MTIRISKFEFVKNTSKYIKGDEVIITHRGEDCLVLSPIGYNKKVEYHKGDVPKFRESYELTPAMATPMAVKKTEPTVIFAKGRDMDTAKKILKPKKDIYSYNCGCSKVDGKFLCPKHGRL